MGEVSCKENAADTGNVVAAALWVRNGATEQIRRYGIGRPTNEFEGGGRALVMGMLILMLMLMLMEMVRFIVSGVKRQKSP